MTTTSTTANATLPLFVAAESLSLFGNSAISIVLPWLVLSRTGDPSVAGLVAAIAAVPSILATLVGGWLIDHVGRKKLPGIIPIFRHCVPAPRITSNQCGAGRPLGGAMGDNEPAQGILDPWSESNGTR